MDRGGREDRRESRRRSRSRSYEGRRRRSSGGGSRPGSRRSRSRSRSAERRRRSDGGSSKDAQPLAQPAAAAQPAPVPAAPPQPPSPAPTVELVAPSRDNLKHLMVTRSDLDALREVERLLVVHHYQHPGSPSLTCLRGLFVRTRFDGYHIRMVNRLVEEGGQVKLLVQAGMSLDSRPVVTWELDIVHVSSANPLVDPTWGKGGQTELAQLQAELTRLNCALPLQQCAAAVVRRRAALHWWDKYQDEPDLQQFLPRLIADMQDEADIQRAARRFELLRTGGGAAVQAEGAVKAAPPQAEPSAVRPAASTGPPKPAPTQSPSSLTQPLPTVSQQQQQQPELQQQQPELQQLQPELQQQQPELQQQQPELQQQQEEQQQQPPQQPPPEQQPEQQKQKQEQQRRESPRDRRRQASLDRKERRESPRRRQRSPDRRQSSPDRRQRRESPRRRQRSPDRKRERSPDRKARRESPARRQRSPDRRRKDLPANLQRRASTPLEQQPQPPQLQQTLSPGGTAARGNHGHTTPDRLVGAAGPELLEARQAAKDSHGRSRSLPTGADARAAAEQPRARPEGSRGASGSRPANGRQSVREPATKDNGAAAAEAAGGKRKRAPIQWQPQEPQPGDRPLMADGSVAPEPPAKAKLQKLGSGGTREPSPAAAADGKGKQRKEAASKAFSITVAGPTGGVQPVGKDAELPPGFGGPDLPAGQHLVPPLHAADFAAEPDGGSGNLVVRVRMPHDLPGAAATGDLSTGGSASTLGGRFDRLNASQRLGSAQLQASPPGTFLLTATGGGGAPMPATAPPTQMLAAASLGAMFDGHQFSGMQQQLVGQQPYGGQQLVPALQQQYGGQALPLPQQHQYGAQALPQQLYSPPGEQFLAMLGGDAVQASVQFGTGSYGDPAERAQSEVGSPSRPPRRGSKGGSSEGGDRRVQMEGSDSHRGGDGGSGSGAGMWCPMTAWEVQAVRLVRDQPGITLGEMAGLHPLPPCWQGTFAAFSAYVMRRKQLFNVRPSGTDRERANVYAATGVRSFLSFKRGVLQYLADHRPRADVRAVLAAVPTEGLPEFLLKELDRNPISFMLKYLGCEVAAVEPARGNVREACLLELRPFPPKEAAGSGMPPFKPVCSYWKKGHCTKGDKCAWAHVLARDFREPPHQAAARGK